MKKILISILSALAGGVAGAFITDRKAREIVSDKEARIEKFQDYFNLTNRWLMLKNQGRSLSLFFQEKGYQTIAIYGVGELGTRLCEELNGTGISIKYAIDKTNGCRRFPVKIYTIAEELPKVDVIIVTPLFDYDEIEEQLIEKVDYPIISLEEAVDYC